MSAPPPGLKNRTQKQESNTEPSLEPMYPTVNNPRDDVSLLDSKYYPASFSKSRSPIQKSKDQNIINTFDEPFEQLIFALKLIKINKKGKKQTRVLAITNVAAYNFGSNLLGMLDFSTPRRRIALMSIESIHSNTSNPNEFILKVPSEYDYSYESTEVELIIETLQHAWSELRNALSRASLRVPLHLKLPMYNLDDNHIHALLTTKSDGSSSNSPAPRSNSSDSQSSLGTSDNNEYLSDLGTESKNGSGSYSSNASNISNASSKGRRKRRTSVSDFTQKSQNKNILDVVNSDDFKNRPRSPSSLRDVLNRTQSMARQNTKSRRMSMRDMLLDSSVQSKQNEISDTSSPNGSTIKPSLSSERPTNPVKKD